MRSSPLFLFALVGASCGTSPSKPEPAAAPSPSTPAARVAIAPTPELTAPMARLGFLRGVWRGTATGMTPDGGRYQVTQTERLGPMLGGDVIVIEGRGAQPDGTIAFSALGVVSYDLAGQKYELRSYAQGRSGTFELALTESGYVWEIPAGPDARVRFTATFTPTTWREVGEYLAGDRPAMQISEMNLTRVGETAWPQD